MTWEKPLVLQDDLVPGDSLQVRARFEGEVMFDIPARAGQRATVLKRRKVEKLRDALTQWLKETAR
jgi:hypothetical protein